ncbi:phospholipase A [Sphingomonas montana]|uniref:phospholipase A n=1 Tax=Sphingomonas montana TaxID=1843236 RepID=UPI00096FB5AF|nr:phospholipase A [Sphingomonas montana]
MMLQSFRLLSLLLLAAAPVAVTAQSQPQRIVSAVMPGADAGSRIVEITVLDGTARLPERIGAELIRGGARQAVTLVRAGADTETGGPAGGRGYVQARYRLALPVDTMGAGVATLALEPGSVGGYAFAVNAAATAPASSAQALAAPVIVADAVEAPSAKPETGNAFLGNLSTYGPIYGVYGPGTNTDARIQIGFKYQLFGAAGAVGGDAPAENGLHFGYTQRLFWNLGKKSSPFRNVEYRPELFYLVPAAAVTDRIVLGGQAGIRHESNGRDGLDSRSINTVYVQPQATTRIGDMVVTVGPRAWFYVGSLEDNPQIKRYRGNTGLFAEVGQVDGWRLSTTTNVAFQSGRASIDALLSYPLARIVASDLNLYVFGQAFAGYGENLLDYTKRQTRVRIGVGFVR